MDTAAADAAINTVVTAAAAAPVVAVVVIAVYYNDCAVYWLAKTNREISLSKLQRCPIFHHTFIYWLRCMSRTELSVSFHLKENIYVTVFVIAVFKKSAMKVP